MASLKGGKADTALPMPTLPMGDLRLPTIPLDLKTAFSLPLGLFCALLLALFCAFTTYTVNPSDEHVQQYYTWYVHVSIMIFIGFGLLMTFLRRYAYSAVALNFFASALVMLEFILVGGFVQQLWTRHAGTTGWDGGKIEINLPLLIDAAFCAGSTMITFGAILGKTTAAQLMWLLVLEVPFYAINQKLVFEYLKGLDIGGGLTIHVFGAYYGLAATMVLSKSGWGLKHSKNGSSYLNDITSMIGTIFLFIYWPSFNGALASNPELEELPVQTQFYCVSNTIISLLGAILATFAMSSALEGKFNMMHIQNATLAGGVAVGSSANLRIQPGGALAIGLLAGSLSTFGFARIQPFLERKIGLKDTCGVHNLHGMPGLLGGFAAAIASAASYGANEILLDAEHHGKSTWGYQLASIACTLGMAVVSGFLGGFLIKWLTPKQLELREAFEDGVMWEGVDPEPSPSDFTGMEHLPDDSAKAPNMC